MATAEVTLVVLLKMPVKGSSKTRLVPALGADGALLVADALLRDTLLRYGRASELAAWRRVACFAPPTAAAAAALADVLASLFGADGGPWECAPMTSHSGDLASSNLGDLLGAEYARVRQANSGPVVFVGMDSPDLPIEFVVDAAATAADGAAAIVPATDGGYVALALPASAPRAVFDDVEWSTANTAASQSSRIKSCGVDCIAAAAAWEDVDDVEDLRNLAARLQKTPGLCPALEAFLPKLCDPRRQNSDASIPSPTYTTWDDRPRRLIRPLPQNATDT
ncbi:hypothetical protein M885DRAFT_94471 [Pelagophyceae sp. CCMP2097]|nr:hypothetical protein M885DRAFT_94471 [Pelagophyceae sp. CCMP2097]